MKTWQLILRLGTVGTLLLSVTAMGVCPAASKAMSSSEGPQPVPSQRSGQHLPCPCDLLPGGCHCGASCCCQASAPEPKPTVPPHDTRQQSVSRHLLVLQVHVALEANGAGRSAIARTASANLVSLTPTLQLEHVRIQT